MISKENVKNLCVYCLNLVAISWLLTVGGELIIRTDIESVYLWMTDNSVKLVLNMILIILFICLLKYLFNSLFISVITIGTIY